MKHYEPELGQMAFGNPSLDYECPEYIEALLRHLNDEVERLVWNAAQYEFNGPAGNYGSHYVNDVFEMRAYYWGECVCGFEARDSEWWHAHPHNTACWVNRYADLEEEFRHERPWDDSIKDRYLGRAKELGWPFDTMIGIAVYCDCGVQAAYAKWVEANYHDPKCPTIMPNFRYRDLSIHWYKYLGRGTSISRDVDPTEATAMFDACLESVRRDSMNGFVGVDMSPSLEELKVMRQKANQPKKLRRWKRR